MPPELPDEATTSLLLELQRMERRLASAGLERPGFLTPRESNQLRYLLGFARLTAFQPGAARGGPSGRPEAEVSAEVAHLRGRIVEALHGPLLQEKDTADRLHRAVGALPLLRPLVAEARRKLVENHASEFSASELDDEAGRRVLVNVAGGGAGAGFVYIGAYEALERAGIVPAYVIGSSIGSLLGLFRARSVPGEWERYASVARSLEMATLFAPLSVRRIYGLPGLLRLRLRSTIGPLFTREDGSPVFISDLAIPFEAVVAGVLRRSFDRLPAEFRDSPREASPRHFGARLAARMWRVAAFFDPQVVKPIVIGADETTAAFDAVDAAGFSAAIPGVLHYDIEEDDERMGAILSEVFRREEVAALVDGGVANNVPVSIAWQRVQAGKLGTRNAVYLAFDCFHPQWDPVNLWLQPITQAVQLQMTRNAPYAHWIVRFEPTLSPVNLMPDAGAIDEATGWGRDSIEQCLPLLRRLLEPASYEPPAG